MEKFNCIVASGPVIVENGKVLLNRHGDTPEARKIWKFVGGKVEINDYKGSDDILRDACHREVKEEMGIDIEIITPLKPMLITRPDEPGQYVVLIHYLATRKGEIVPGEDIVEWKWFNIDKLPSDCAPNIKPVIKEYKQLIDQKNKILATAVHEL